MEEHDCEPLASLSVTEIGEFIRFDSCERRLKLGLNGRELARELPFAERLFNTLDPVLRREGEERENEWERTIREAGLQDLTGYGRGDGEEHTWEEGTTGTAIHDFADSVRELEEGDRAYGREISVEGQIGAFQISGQIDFVLLLWTGGRPKLRIVECKASRKDRTYHRIQVAIYRLLVLQYLSANPLQVGGFTIEDEDDIECVVARIDESTNNSQDILSLPALDMEMITADARQLLSGSGPIAHVVETDLEELDYQLNPKCDGCVFDVHCFPESARHRRLELLGIDPTNIRVLEESGVNSIDELAELDTEDPIVEDLRESHEFTENISELIQRAGVRRSTLPGGEEEPDHYEVEAAENQAESQLPEHQIDGDRLIRVYLSVNYDYVENRIGALAAHVTQSEGRLHTGFTRDEEGSWQPDPGIEERVAEGDEGDEDHERPVQGETFHRTKTTAWSGNYEQDNGSERQLIQGFLMELVDTIAEVAGEESVRLHFYVWSRSEMAQLMEACSRVGSRLLAHLRELLGSRQSLEQLIYSVLQEEVDNRFTLGWTGRGLSVATSLRWFGQTYHWHRRVAGEEVALDRRLAQDIFDFKTDLGLTAEGEWAESREDADLVHKFEIRARFFDSLPAPYWRALWRDLPDPDEVEDTKVANSIRRYNRIAQPGILRAYLEARVHALRWIEERIQYKNDEIVKPRMEVADLPDFSLGVEDTAQAAIDFLRLDHHVGVTDWLAKNLAPPTHRAPKGRTIPLRDVTVGNSQNELIATIDLEEHAVDAEVLRGRCSFEDGSFVRVSPCFEDPEQGQTINQLLDGGVTCVIDELNWENRQVSLEIVPQYQNDRYRLTSTLQGDPHDVRFEHATLDENPSAYTSSRVDRHLRNTPGSPVYEWFNPEAPDIPPSPPLPEGRKNTYHQLLDDFVFPGEQFGLTEEQIQACIEGLETRVQLVLGPPGTGKTATSAISTLLRIAESISSGNIVFVAGNTHRAVDTLLGSLDRARETFAQCASRHDVDMPRVEVVKAHSNQVSEHSDGDIIDIRAENDYQSTLSSLLDEGVVIVGGTTSAILKHANYLNELASFNGIPVPMLVVDESSMMVFPHFLALTSWVSPDGEIMLAGDHRQLAPITAHDWEEEDRPPVEIYRPFVSAYEAVRRLVDHEEEELTDSEIRESELRYTHRLPASVRSLVGRLYQNLDNVELQGRPFEAENGEDTIDDLGRVATGSNGLYLVLHEERSSRENNEFEATLIEQILQGVEDELDDNSVAIVTPHRAQRAQLRERLAQFANPIQVIDTVEKVQGAGIPTVVVSSTVSNPSAISARAEFILDLNRANVAFSRAEERLVVVASRSLIDHVPTELEHYESSMLWKALRELCTETVSTDVINGRRVEVLTPSREALQSID